MKALRFIGGKLNLDDVAMPDAPGEALVRVEMSGICNTDLEIVRGYADFEGTIGHEFVGTVERCTVRPELEGKRVVGEINAGCGKCELCLSGDPRHCAARTVLGIHGRDGCHAEFLTLPAVNLIAVPEGVSNERAVFAEPLAAAYGITERAEIDAGTSVAVIGDGKLGLLCAMALALKSENVTLIGKHAEKMAITAETGVSTTLVGETAELSRSFDVVVEASGNESGFATALDIVQPRGRIVLKSTFAGRPVWDAARVVVDEITIIGSRCGRFAPAVELLKDGKIPVEKLIDDIYPMSSGIEAFRRAGEKGSMKILLSNTA